MRVLVAGATGAVGRPLVAALTAAGHEPLAGSRSAEGAESLRALGAEPVAFDALDAEATAAAVAAARPDAIVNQLTAIPKRLNPRRMESQFATTSRLRREGTANLMAAAAAHGVGRVVAQSIAFACRPTPGGGLWTEDDPLAVELGEIVAAVAALEERTQSTPGVDGLVLRYGFFYGPGTAYAGSDGPAAADVRRRRMPLVGDGGGVWPWIHVEDAAAATVAALERGAPGVYNVVDDDPAPVRDWLPAYAEALGARPPRRVPVFMARIAAGRLGVHYMTTLQGASNAKARSDLSWQPRYASWRQGFSEALG